MQVLSKTNHVGWDTHNDELLDASGLNELGEQVLMKSVYDPWYFQDRDAHVVSTISMCDPFGMADHHL